MNGIQGRLPDPAPSDPPGPSEFGGLSPAYRAAAIRALRVRPLDLLVVGGGITGAGVARDAALRGMRVGLVEKRDFASGTSSRSSKIIHGGVRYLEYLQLGLVRESARERKILRGIAPHLVHPLPFLYPVFAGESFLKIRAGLKLFDFLSGSAGSERSRALDADATRGYLPGLREPLKGSVLYPEYITDDARFTLANVASAARHGAWAVNHARVEGLLRRSGRVVGARVRDTESDRAFDVEAEVTVLAVGPWAPEVLSASGLPMPKPIIPSKGIHILLDRTRLPLKGATFLRSSSGRRGLAMPRGPWVYVGTSDEEYREDMDRPRAHPAEIAELLEMTRDCFPEADLGSEDIRGSWAGIRPLILEPGKTTREMSRHDEVWIAPPGLVTVAGGKLTTYRPMARRILEAVSRARGRNLPGGERTASVGLEGRPDRPMADFRADMRRKLQEVGVGERIRERLGFLYGTELTRLLHYGRENAEWLETLAPGVPALRGEVRLAIETGMALTLEDILDRRMALLLFSANGGREAADEAARIAGPMLGWSAGRRGEEVESYNRLAREHGPPAGPPASVDTGIQPG